MHEKIIEISGINPLELFGANEVKLKLIKSFFPKLKVVARGANLKVLGEKVLLSEFSEAITATSKAGAAPAMVTVAAARLQLLERLTSDPSRSFGMGDQFSYGYLGFAVGPDVVGLDHLIFYSAAQQLQAANAKPGVCVCVCVRTCVRVCVCVCVWVCGGSIATVTNTRARTHTHTHTHTHKYTHT